MPAAPDFPPPPDRVVPKRALISLSDKTGLVEAARALHDLGVELVSTGGTRAAIAAAGLPVRDVAELTGFPEMMDGRVKTLHPKVHGALLGVRDAPAHAEAMRAHGIEPIDLVWIDLYPFEVTVAAGGDFAAAVENIDIGGPAMIRSSAKNHGYVAVCVDKAALDEVLAALQADGATDLALRKRLAARAFARTAAYDAAVSNWFAAQVGDAAPARRTISGRLVQAMRYGENPHQSAAFYRDAEPAPGTLAHYRQLQGKELSYNNIADADAAWECVKSFHAPACVIVKHANPCGVAIGRSCGEAYAKAFSTDPTSAFGGIIAFNRPLDADTAAEVARQFVEVLIAPGFADGARAVFAAKQNVRLLEIPLADGGNTFDFKRVGGGLLVQTLDSRNVAPGELRVVTEIAPTEAQLADLLFAWRVAKFVKSNAIVFCGNGQTLGVGAGQMSRIDSARIATIKASNAALSLAGSAVASDAFFPFRDGLDVVVDAGAACVIQPGGSVRDDEVIAAANERGIAMVFTGVRHFRH